MQISWHHIKLYYLPYIPSISIYLTFKICRSNIFNTILRVIACHFNVSNLYFMLKITKKIYIKSLNAKYLSQLI